MTSIEEFAARYVAVWNEPDAATEETGGCPGLQAGGESGAVPPGAASARRGIPGRPHAG
jgi:hypothetical protein